MTAARAFEMGDRLVYEGRAYIVCGFTPMGVEPARIYLAETTARRPYEPARVVSVRADSVAASEPESEVA